MTDLCSQIRCRAAAALIFCFPALTWADGGTVRAIRQLGNYQVTVFTAPSPLHAGPADISVFVQDAHAGTAHTEFAVTVEAHPARQPLKKLRGPATVEAATNKLFRAIQLDLDVPGPWSLSVEVATPEGTKKLAIAVEAGGAAPAWVSLALWIGWPAIALFFFGVHRWLVHRRQRTSRRAALGPTARAAV